MSSAPKKSPADNDAAAASSTRAWQSVSSPSEPSAGRIPTNRYFTFFAIAILGGAVDLISKELIFRWRGLPRRGNEWWIIEGFFGIETSVNPGALFGMGAGYSWLFAALSIVAATGIITWLFIFGAARDRWLTVALGSVTGGIAGNLYDRLGLWDSTGLPAELSHGVRDWILFRYERHTWPNFNIADTLLVTGAIMLVLHALLWRDTSPQETPEENPAATKTRRRSGRPQAGKPTA